MVSHPSSEKVKMSQPSKTCITSRDQTSMSAAKPTSVIRRLSRLTDFSEFNMEISFMPVSVTNVNERFMLCKFRRPERCWSPL
eukprot:UN21866